ncbi:DNA-protecting protein DprA [Candidatus Woesebacteria bacterium]|nr:DNA-protecting protein DprA [Candidatus Woesebacteria bacterium]
MTERESWIAFSAFPQIGPARFTLIKKYFGNAKKAWKAPIGEYIKIGFSKKLADSFEKFRKEKFDIGSYLVQLDKLGIQVLRYDDTDYPERLKKIDDSPYILYVRKSLKSIRSIKNTIDIKGLSDVSVAVVGTRKMTSYGREVTERLVTELVNAGVTIISGLALGIDSVAHRTAIDTGGRTIAVLGGGLDEIYPPSNRQLAAEILGKDRGLLLSEYPLFYPSMPQNFPVRNRIVSGLSQGIVVVEGMKKSGTLLTASSAASQGREVFAVPGPITSPTSQAPNFLIRQGAKLVESAEDILEELKIESRVVKMEARKVIPETKEEKKLLKVLETEGLDIDTIVRMSGLQAGVVLGTLTQMELKGLVRNMGGIYRTNSE